MKIKNLLILLKEILSPFTEKDWKFPEFFENYDQYHHNVSTGNMIRARLIENWFEPNSTVLDVGIGDGTVANYLKKKKNVKISGIDVSSVSCEKAKKIGINAEVRDINHGLGLEENEFFDYILMSEVIEHTMYPQRLLLEAIHHAKKGVVVTIPNSGYIQWRIHLLRGYFPRQSFTHLHFWSINDFKIFCNVLNIKTLKLKTSAKSTFSIWKNLFSWQQCWLLEPKLEE